jgi:hypothetical protein
VPSEPQGCRSSCAAIRASETSNLATLIGGLIAARFFISMAIVALLGISPEIIGSYAVPTSSGGRLRIASVRRASGRPSAHGNEPNVGVGGRRSDRDLEGVDFLQPARAIRALAVLVHQVVERQRDSAPLQDRHALRATADSWRSSRPPTSNPSKVSRIEGSVKRTAPPVARTVEGSP